LRFVHAADIHLDSPLRGLARYPGAPVEALRGATRAALGNLVDLCLAEEAELLVIAGDLYDGDWRDYNTGLYFAAQMARLAREGVRVVMVRGNHDAASRITRSLRLPEGVSELASRRAQSLVLEDLGVAVHGRSYPGREVREDLTAAYPDAVPGLFNIGLLHTAVNGRPGHEPYAPCTLEGLAGKGYQYWALGHVHRREVLSTDPWVVFPGNLQGRHARETGPKGATLVTVEDGQVVDVAHRALDVVRWESLTLDATAAASGHDVVDAARSALSRAAEQAEDRILAVRLTVTGASPAHAQLVADPDAWENDLRAAASEAGAQVWLEKVALDTRLPLDLEALRGQDDPVGDLARYLRDLQQDPAALADLGQSLEDLRRKLPAEYRQLDDALDLEDPATLAGLLDEVGQLLLPRLLSGGAKG
jgi:exonuclease SbcD